MLEYHLKITKSASGKIRENWSQSKNRIYMFEADENTGTERNNGIILDSDYDSDNM